MIVTLPQICKDLFLLTSRMGDRVQNWLAHHFGNIQPVQESLVTDYDGHYAESDDTVVLSSNSNTASISTQPIQVNIVSSTTKD